MPQMTQPTPMPQLSPAPAERAPVERAPIERAPRLTTILLVARASSGGRDDLCRIRDVSAGGMRIDILAPLAAGQPIVIELKNGVVVECEVVWVAQGQAGLRFKALVDIALILAHTLRVPTPSAPTMRSLRLSARCVVSLRRDGHILSAILTNISQGGAQLETSGKIVSGDDIVLLIPGLGARHATVRWVREAAAGVAFIEKLGFTDLAAWLATPQRFARQAAEPFNLIRQNS